MNQPIDLAGAARKLSSADDRTLGQIVALVDGLPKRGAMDSLIDPLRPRLSRLRPARPITLERILTMPFESLLVAPSGWSPGMLRIPRHHLEPMHKLILEAIDPGLRQTLNRHLRGYTMNEGTIVLALGRELWPAAAEAAATLAARRGIAGKEERALNGSIRLVAHLLLLGEKVVRTLWALPPRPIVDVSQSMHERIRELLEAAAEKGRDSFMITTELLLSCSDTPTLILEPLLTADIEAGERERLNLAAMIAESCVSQMGVLLDSLVRGEETTIRACRDPLVRIVSNIESLSELPTDIKFDRRMLRKLREATFAFIRDRLERALKHEIRDAFADTALLEKDPAVGRRLEEAAGTAANMRLMGRCVGLATPIEFLFRQSCEELGAIADDPDSPRAVFMDRVRIIEILFGSSEALKLVRKRKVTV